MFPYKDDNPTVLAPIVTLGIIITNVVVWVLVQGAGAQQAVAASVCHFGLIPGELLGTVPVGTAVPLGPRMTCVLENPHYVAVLTSMFLHGGWGHLIGNMWFLWVFGNNIEDSMGHSRFVFFYVICGVAAAAAQVLTDAHGRVPMVGASGAISGVMGAYLLLYPRVRVHSLIVLGVFITRVAVPAYLMLGYWFILQLLLGTAGTLSKVQGGVAFWAHVGGFVAGLVLIKLFANPELTRRREEEFGEWQGF